MAEVLSAKGLKKSYGKGAAAVPVLRGLDLALNSGELSIILGPSGSGKSTLLNLLGLMDTPDEGDVVFSGVSTRAMDETQRCRLRNERLGFIFQFDSLLPEFTVLENVTMPARIAAAQGRRAPTPAQARARAEELLGRLGLPALLERLPNQISGGERQRVALCRALINNPPVLLADEPTGNLDKANGEMVFCDLKALARDQGTSILMVTHNESARAYASRVLRMQDGNLGPER